MGDGERVRGNPVAWVLWVAGAVLLGGAAGEVSLDHSGAAQAIGLGLVLCTASHGIHLYWRMDPRNRPRELGQGQSRSGT